MVTETDSVNRPLPPSRPKLFVDQQVIPVLIDAAAAVEARIETVANMTRRNPVLVCGAVLGIGWLLGAVPELRRRRKPI